MRDTQSLLEQRVMATVGVIYTTRKVFSPVMLKLYVLALAALALWRLVWVTRIEQNFVRVLNGGATAEWRYAFSAFTHTHTIVLVTIAVAVVAFVGLVLDLARSAASPRQRLAY
jgi:hypothetical protein